VTDEHRRQPTAAVAVAVFSRARFRAATIEGFGLWVLGPQLSRHCRRVVAIDRHR